MQLTISDNNRVNVWNEKKLILTPRHFSRKSAAFINLFNKMQLFYPLQSIDYAFR